MLGGEAQQLPLGAGPRPAVLLDRDQHAEDAALIVRHRGDRHRLRRQAEVEVGGRLGGRQVDAAQPPAAQHLELGDLGDVAGIGDPGVAGGAAARDEHREP